MSTSPQRQPVSPSSSLSSFSVISSHSRTSTSGQVLSDDDDEIVFSPRMTNSQLSAGGGGFGHHDFNSEDDYILIGSAPASPSSRVASPGYSLLSSLASLRLDQAIEVDVRSPTESAQSPSSLESSAIDFRSTLSRASSRSILATDHQGEHADEMSLPAPQHSVERLTTERPVSPASLQDGLRTPGPLSEHLLATPTVASTRIPQTPVTKQPLKDDLARRSQKKIDHSRATSYPSPSPSPPAVEPPRSPAQVPPASSAKASPNSKTARRRRQRRKANAAKKTTSTDDDEDEDETAYQNAVDYVSNYLSNPKQAGKELRLPLLQAIVVELGLCPPASGSLPSSIKAAKALLRAKVHINVRDYVAAREQGLEALKKIMFPSRNRLMKDLRTRRVPIDWVKQHGLSMFLITI